MLWGYEIWSIIKYSASHFGLSSAVGWLAYWLTLTILSHTGLEAVIPRRRTSLLLLSVALSSALLVHVAEDFMLNWF